MSPPLFEPAYLLHARPYRNTSLLADFFTLNHGRVNGVVRGARGEKSKLRGFVQPFTPLMINWIGHGDLVTIRQVEPARTTQNLKGEAILYGFYINELLARLLKVREAHADLYQAYETLLNYFVQGECAEQHLRVFEKRLLLNLGYALQLTHEHHTDCSVEANAWYTFVPDAGPQRVLDQAATDFAVRGASLLALHNENFTSIEILQDAKRLMRRALRSLLGDKPLKSRELFG